LKYIRNWNTNAKYSMITQKVLQHILQSFPPEKLEHISNIKELMEGIIPYTLRHNQRVDKLLQQSYLIDYTLQAITLQSLSSNSMLEGDEPVSKKLKVSE